MTGVHFMSICTFFLLLHCILSNISSFVDRDMFCRFAGIGVGHGTQYRIPSMDEITSNDNTSEDATLPMAESEDEGDDIFHAGGESLFEVLPSDGNTTSDDGYDDDEGSDPGSRLSDGDNDSEPDGLGEDDESGFEF